MPVVPVLRHVLRGTIRAQVQYQVVLGERLIRAYNKNRALEIFLGTDGPASTATFEANLVQMRVALAARS